MTSYRPPESPAQLDESPRRRYYTGRNLKRVQAISDLRARTHRLMPRFVLEYLEGGAGQEATLDRERACFADWRILPRTMVDESRRDVSSQVLGRRAPLPLAIAPTGLNGVVMRGGDVALARAAASCQVPFTQSTMSNESIEDVAKVKGLRHWFQLYVFGEESVWQELVDRAAAAGCEALVLTTNAQIFGDREWDSRTRRPSKVPTLRTTANAAGHPRWLATTLNRGMPRFPNAIDFVPKNKRGFFEATTWIRSQMWKDLSWADIARIRQRWNGPFFIKGLLHPDEIERAAEAGVTGVILSSHGGRQADWALAPLDVLQKARSLLGPDIAIYLAGGIRHGSDILKAIALGADAVMTGRATLYGLAAHGQAGVERAIELLKSEMKNEIGQYGARTLEDLAPAMLVRRDHLPL